MFYLYIFDYTSNEYVKAGPARPYEEALEFAEYLGSKNFFVEPVLEER